MNGSLYRRRDIVVTDRHAQADRGYLRREEAYGMIRALAKAGTPIKETVRRTARSRKLVRDIVRDGGDVFRYRSNVLEPHGAGDDVPEGKLTSFPMAVQRKEPFATA